MEFDESYRVQLNQLLCNQTTHISLGHPREAITEEEESSYKRLNESDGYFSQH